MDLKLNDIDFFDYCRDLRQNYRRFRFKISTDGFAEGRCIINYVLDVLDNKYTPLFKNLYSNSREFIDVKYYQKL